METLRRAGRDAAQLAVARIGDTVLPVAGPRELVLTSPNVRLQTRQKWSIGEKEFLSTPNTRNEMMLKEAGEFAGHLKRCEKDIRALKNATEGGLRHACRRTRPPSLAVHGSWTTV